jgi:putative ATPase
MRCDDRGMSNDATLLGALAPAAPLAARMRPATLDEVVGQEALVGPGAPLRRLLERGEMPSLLLWGPPGSGKSTLAAVIAAAVRAVPTSLSATSDGVAEVRKAVAAATERRAHGEQTLLFIDELHRFSRTQQDALLPHVEAGTIILIGATTEPPPRAISPALLSRMRTFRLTALSPEDLATLLQRALDDTRGFGGTITVDDDARRQLIGYAGGDARRMLTLLELATLMTPAGKPVTPNEVLLAAQDRSLPYDQSGVTSALIKSIRGNDPDAAIWWLATALEGGEDPRIIARRLLVSASEDVGNADPDALSLAVAAAQVVELAGSPECDYALAQAVTYLASTHKSPRAGEALAAAREQITQSGQLPVPGHLRAAARTYQSPHAVGEPFHISQEYLPSEISTKRFYDPSGSGAEERLRDRIVALRVARQKTERP